MSPSSRTPSMRAKLKLWSPKVDGKHLKSKCINEDEVIVVVEAEMASTRQDLFDWRR